MVEEDHSDSMFEKVVGMIIECVKWSIFPNATGFDFKLPRTFIFGTYLKLQRWQQFRYINLSMFDFFASSNFTIN